MFLHQFNLKSKFGDIKEISLNKKIIHHFKYTSLKILKIKIILDLKNKIYLNLIVFDSSFTISIKQITIFENLLYAQSCKFCQAIVYRNFFRNFKHSLCIFRSRSQLFP